MATKSFKDLIVWRKSKNLAIAVYKLTDKFPRAELFGLTSQMRRAVVSISSNIAESYHRFGRKEKDQFLKIAFGSGSELESQVEISKSIFSDLDYNEVDGCLSEVMRILNNFVTRS